MSQNVRRTMSALPTVTLDTRNISPLLLPSGQGKNKPSTPTSTITSPKSTPPRLSTPTSMTAPLTTFSRPRSCCLCDKQNPGDFSPTTKYLAVCQLCSQDFCPIHQHIQYPTICNTNHSKYYHQCLEQARRDVVKRHQQCQLEGTSPGDSLSIESEAEEILTRAGVYPSMGERERAIWRSSPVLNTRAQQPDGQNPSQRQQHKTTERGESPLIETKELIGADIAV